VVLHIFSLTIEIRLDQKRTRKNYEDMIRIEESIEKNRFHALQEMSHRF
jgi:hypothetical protein